MERPRSSASSVNRAIKGLTMVRPRMAKRIQVITARVMPLPAAFVAVSVSFSPSFLERYDAIPTPVPTPNAIKRF